MTERGYGEADRLETRGEIRALATRVGELAEQCAVLNFQIKSLAHDVTSSEQKIDDFSKKITALEFASAKPLWMSAGVCAAALLIGWFLQAWEGFGKLFHK